LPSFSGFNARLAILEMISMGLPPTIYVGIDFIERSLAKLFMCGSTLKKILLFN